MRKSGFLILCLFAIAVLTGCSRDTADKYVGEQITSMKEKGSDNFATLLDEGIAESNEAFVVQFPEELKEPYQDFLKDSFNAITFKVSSAKKKNDRTFSVQVTYRPIDIKRTTESSNRKYLDTLESTDLTEAASGILENDTKLLTDSPVHNEEVISTLEVTKKGEKYSITEDSLKEFVGQAIVNYMDPYNQVSDIIDAHHFIKAYFDASFKGDVAQFAVYTGRTEEEALAWYEKDAFDPPADLSADYVDRYKAALKSIVSQCKYTVGIPKREAANASYTVDITTTPNKSFADAYHEFEGGTYYSLNEASAGLVEAMEKYAAAPTFGEETTQNVTINSSSLLSASQENSELYTLASTILTMP